ncbi:MAG: hypothetical protein BMS9Abin07_0724 [Acidimicrobiia bacterium]|nr:MAG: hypothetical protein BMS9Abin07_0724 [Acidimicrobiia bacterium]
MTNTDQGSIDVSFASRRTFIGRLRGGVAAFVYPLLLLAFSLSVGFRKAGDLQDFAASFVGSILTVVALPTVWFVSFDFIDVTRMTVLVFGLVTSLPLWYLLGAAIGGRSETWGNWFRTYAATCMLWTLANFAALAVIATVVE